MDISLSKLPWYGQIGAFLVLSALSIYGFYTYYVSDVQAELTIKPSTHVSISAHTERNDVSLVEGRFYTVVHTFAFTYNFSANVSWANLLQYDNESRIAGVQSRFRWILKPGNDVFLVMNRGWYRSFDGRYLPNYDKGSVKLQYTFRL